MSEEDDIRAALVADGRTGFEHLVAEIMNDVVLPALRSARRSALMEAAGIAEKHGKAEPYGHAKARANMIADELLSLAEGETASPSDTLTEGETK
jgi:uncharacterized protein with ATP-grasp and redox domains